MSKELKRPYVDFCCPSAVQVTGSGYHVRFKDYSILMNFGGVQGMGNIYEEYKINKSLPKGIKPKEIDLILIEELHYDHQSRVPYLYAKGCEAPIYIPKGSTQLLKVMFEDSVKIMASDCEKISNKYNVNATPLYTMEDANNALSHVVEVDYHEVVNFNDNISFEFYPSEHILHSAQVMLTLRDGNIMKRIGYTSDIGSPNLKHYYLKKFERLPYCDVLIGEATYAAQTRNHKPKDRKVDIQKIKSVILDAQDTNSTVIIPVFSFDRLEQMLTTIYEIYQEDSKFYQDIIVDTPLGIKLAKLWESDNEAEEQLWDKVSNWNKVKWISDYESSLQLQQSNKPYIVLSSSGMMNAGRVLSWVKYKLPNPNNTIMFCGYSSEDSLATEIKRGEKKYLEIDGDMVKNGAKVVTLNSFSSHASHDELIDYYRNAKCGRIYIVHSDMDDKTQFCKELQEIIRKDGNTTKVICTNADTKCYLS